MTRYDRYGDPAWEEQYPQTTSLVKKLLQTPEHTLIAHYDTNNWLLIQKGETKDSPRILFAQLNAPDAPFSAALPYRVGDDVTDVISGITWLPEYVTVTWLVWNAHSLTCTKQAAARATYQQRWPHHCRRCQGYGQFIDRYDPSAAGVSLSSGYMLGAEPCDACTEHNLCPRCMLLGLQLPSEENGYEYGKGPCRICGWDYEQGGIPDDSCICYSGN
jgi:hypothetical protein